MAALDSRTNIRQEDIMGKKPQGVPSLEEEISLLRKRLEDAVSLENSFTSDLVVTNSRLLDEKINEYMRRAD